ncbi:MAG: tetratricopeptide repeat protein [Candidatus Pseudobacter hemicellulosilyticus]|uniref:Tetratricopeptide repeat protein n=1 Tax=Candidatus Pseudobacter hemicellulosilyticus TaxID=3121375 RepID=A0AAJ5WMW0_9BACT|nr:MAG: tetratricopeptide repeat protein [Pseudobacter sp.]
MNPAGRFYGIVFAIVVSHFCFDARAQVMSPIDSMRLVLLNNPAVDSNSVKTIFRMAKAFSVVDADSSFHYATRGLAMSQKIKWNKGIATLYDLIGTLYSNNSDYVKAREYYNLAYEVNRKSGNTKGEIVNTINIGVVCQRQGDGVKALEYAFKALKMAQQTKDEDYTALIYGNISDVYVFNADYAKAISYSLKGYQEYKRLENTAGIATTANQVANVYLQLNELSKSEQYLTESLDLYTGMADKTGQAKVLSNLSLVYDKDKGKKLEYLFKARKLYDELNPLSTQSITNMGNIGGTYAEIVKYALKDSIGHHSLIPATYAGIRDKATYYLNNAISASKQVEDLDNLLYFSENLAQLQELNGQYKEALENYKTFWQLTDSLYSQENKNKLATQEAEFLFQQKEEKYKTEQQLAKLKTRQIYLYGSIIAVLICSVLLYILNRYRLNQLRLKNELLKIESEKKAKELLYQSQLSESELKAIRSQMNPHFIFNVLNSIESYIMDNDKKTASRLVQKFASLSRLILENSTRSLVTADKEWKALLLYTELEAIRYSNSFTYKFVKDENLALQTILLPPMLIQPLIENAILHGLIINTQPDAQLEVAFRKTATGVCITVSDNGIGIDSGYTRTKQGTGVKETSMGLVSIKERIEIINMQHPTTEATFSIKAGENGKGTVAMICLPALSKR